MFIPRYSFEYYIISVLLGSHGHDVLAQQQQQQNIFQVPMNIFQSQPDGFFQPIMEVGAGTPPQISRAIFDTGSSDFITPETEGSLCQSDRGMCGQNSYFTSGSFSIDQSSSAIITQTQLDTSFANGQAFQGAFVQETLKVGNQSVPQVQFGLMQQGDITPAGQLFPVLGVGPISGEANALKDGTIYDNLPAQMRKSGMINANLYGVYMNDFRNGNGSVTFGGVDMAKFTGQLQEAPIMPDDSGEISGFVTDFSSIKLSSNENASTSPETIDLTPQDGLPPVLLDTGNPLISIPEASARSLANELGITYDAQNGFGSIPCSIGAQGETIDFAFNGGQAKISVPMEMMLIPASSVGLPGGPAENFTQGATNAASRSKSRGVIRSRHSYRSRKRTHYRRQARDTARPSRISTRQNAGAGDCFLAMDTSPADLASIGAPFFQAAYFVFDMEASRMLMAQAVVNATESNMQPLPS
ncbi:acid protease [Corynespora cassiicola Philippines]|uniref:Acid protease n=1 Tax=Corynespora cassiicola Philippines TaxID=1448308 RepID=A0A2T2NYA6_CORCC|nr:acid protease [Corynespora cassiicola Philippines]